MVAQDDKAKEKMKAEQELRDAKAALEKYGRTRFMATVWRCMMVRADLVNLSTQRSLTVFVFDFAQMVRSIPATTRRRPF